MSKCLVGFGHLVDVLALLDRVVEIAGEREPVFENGMALSLQQQLIAVVDERRQVPLHAQRNSLAAGDVVIFLRLRRADGDVGAGNGNRVLNNDGAFLIEVEVVAGAEAFVTLSTP